MKCLVAKWQASEPSNCESPARRIADVREVFLAFLKLGLTSFGGPIAHLGYFRNEFVGRRRWLDEENYAQIVALCQFLPGPTSSQVGIIIGYTRAGGFGALAAWCGFTLPSVLALIGFARGVQALPNIGASGAIHGLLAASVAIVALAVVNMAAALTPDRPRRTLAVGIAIGALIVPANGFAQLVLIAVGAFSGWLFSFASSARTTAPSESSSSGRDMRKGNQRLALASAVVFHLADSRFADHRSSSAFWTSARIRKILCRGRLGLRRRAHLCCRCSRRKSSRRAGFRKPAFWPDMAPRKPFPGHCFGFAAYLGYAMNGSPLHELAGAALCLGAIFLPSFLLVAAVLPIWTRVRGYSIASATLLGVNAAVVGPLLAALYNPVWLSAVHSTTDVALVLAAILALAIWRLPAYIVVVGSALIVQLIRL